MTEARELYEKVIKNEFCIGCGVCASVKNSPFKIHMNEYGNIVAFADDDLDNNDAKVLDICPFSSSSKNEDEISEVVFSDVKNNDVRIGKYLECFAGYVKEGEYREKGSSGGIGKWIGAALLKENKIDYFIQVVPNDLNDPQKSLFHYSVFSEYNDVLAGSKSSYYPTTLVETIQTIKENDGRYAITGVPCFIKSLRLLTGKDELIKQRIKFTIGIVCGGMKSANQSKMIGWELGVHPDNLVAIDFRRKYNDRPASQKIYQVWSNIDQIERYKNAGEIYGTDYGSGFFKPNACDYCDDVVGETADISIGDAWLPQFVKDPKGTSIIVVRNKEILDLLKRHESKDKIKLYPLSADDVANSQAGGFRHRRDALSLRLQKKASSGEWYPPKRIYAEAGQYDIPAKRKIIYTLREEIAQKSHGAFLKALELNNLEQFKAEMNPLVKKYNIANNGSFVVSTIKRVKGKLKRIIGFF